MFVIIVFALAANTGRAASFASLTIPEFIPADKGQPVVVPVEFDPGTFDNVNTFVFKIQYNAQLLALDKTDGNNDDIPDSIQFNLPVGFEATVDNSVASGTGSLFITIINDSSPLPGLSKATLIEITFTAGSPVNPTLTDIIFATDPPPFFANKQGVLISGVFDGGSVAIGDVAIPTATATKALPTATATQAPPTATSTLGPPTPTLPPFYMPAVMYSFTPTPVATATPIVPTATATAIGPTATATSAPPTATSVVPTATGVAPTATPQPPTPTPGPFCGQLVVNGGMEDNSGWLININAFPAAYVSDFAHTGNRSMRIGIVNSWENRYSYSSIQQDVTIPQSASRATLGFWLVPTTTGRQATRIAPPEIVPTEYTDGTLEALADDVQMVLLFDQAGNQHVLLFQRVSLGGWAYYEMNLDRFRGQRVTLYFGVFNNGTGGVTGMYLDDVALTYCN